MNKKNTLWPFLCALALILIISCYYKMYIMQEYLNNNNISSNNQSLFPVIESSMQQYKLNGIELKGDSILLAQLQEMSKNNEIIIFRFGDFTCDVCVENAMIDLLDFLVQNKKIYIIVNYQDTVKYRDIVNKYTKSAELNFINIVYGSSMYIQHKDESFPPYLFTIKNGSLIPQKLFIYVKECPEINRRYFNLIFNEN